MAEPSCVSILFIASDSGEKVYTGKILSCLQNSSTTYRLLSLLMQKIDVVIASVVFFMTAGEAKIEICEVVVITELGLSEAPSENSVIGFVDSTF